MTIADAQAEALELARIERHVANGEPGEIKPCKRNAVTGKIEPFATINHSWEYSGSDYRRGLLPQGVAQELRIAERELPEAMVLNLVAFEHGNRRLQVVQGTVVAPSGDTRFWRFGLTLSEMV